MPGGRWPLQSSARDMYPSHTPAQPTWTPAPGSSSPGLPAPPPLEATRMKTAKAPPSLLGAPAGGLELVGQGQGSQAWWRSELSIQGQGCPKVRGTRTLGIPNSLWLYHVWETLASAQVVSIHTINLTCLGRTGHGVKNISAPHALWVWHVLQMPDLVLIHRTAHLQHYLGPQFQPTQGSVKEPFPLPLLCPEICCSLSSSPEWRKSWHCIPPHVQSWWRTPKNMDIPKCYRTGSPTRQEVER